MSVSTLDIAWAAGFLEGEGCFQSQRKNPAIGVHQKQKEPLERLLRMFGGSICFFGKNKMSAGKIRDGYWSWCLSGYKAAGLMMTVFTLLSPRRKEQAGKVLEIWRNSRPGTHTQREYCFKGHKMSETAYVNKKTGRRACMACRTKWHLDRKAAKSGSGELARLGLPVSPALPRAI